MVSSVMIPSDRVSTAQNVQFILMETHRAYVQLVGLGNSANLKIHVCQLLVLMVVCARVLSKEELYSMIVAVPRVSEDKIALLLMPVPPTLVRTGLVVPTGMGVTTAHAPQDTKDEAAEWTLMNAELLVFVKMGANVLTLLVPFAVAALAALLANYVKFPTFHAHPHNAKMEAPADQLGTSRTSVSAYQVSKDQTAR